MKGLVRAVLVLLLAAAPLAAQTDERWNEVAVRVTGTAPGGIVMVDRGSSDGLAVGDVVFFYPLGGGVWAGNVVEAVERSASVRLRDPTRPIVPGTRAVVRVPKSRLTPVPPVAPEPAPGSVPEESPPPSHPDWQRDDDPWQPGMPLLAIEGLRPETRAPRTGGRAYLIGDHIHSFESGADLRTDSFVRLGADAWMENPFGRGGLLEIDAEQNYRASELPDGDDADSNLRLDRLSYAWGGTRFEPERHEAGRFLQHALPELGVLDGYEWSLRRENGQRFGASAGFMPEPDADMESGHDFQLAAFYEWVADEREQLSAAAGFQKSWHDGAADRDLLVGRVQYLPSPSQQTWDFLGTTWIDLYTSGDETKDAAVELTQANLSTTRRFEGGDELTVSYVHMLFPEIDRNEFLPVTAAQLADDHVDRLGVSGWKGLDARRRLHARLGGWIDEDETGGDTELGLEVADLIGEDSTTDGALFASLGEFSSLYGARFSYGQGLARGRWDALYEIGLSDQLGFDEESDDLLQQRLRASRDFYGSSGWSVSGYAETRFYDDEGSWLLGVYAQWSF